VTRETREGWPLLTVETEVNGDSKSTTWLVCWAGSAGARYFCSALAALFGLVQNFFFLTVPYISIPFSPTPSKLDRQPCWVACLLVCVSGGDRRREGERRRKCGEREEEKKI
jgi:hypothetical protein